MNNMHSVANSEACLDERSFSKSYFITHFSGLLLHSFRVKIVGKDILNVL